MNESFVCEFCEKNFKNKHVLKSHLIRGKKCLKQRGLKLETTFICKGCNTSIISNIALRDHQEICKNYAIFMVRNEYEKKLSEMEKTICGLKHTIIYLSEKHENCIVEINSKHDKELVEVKNNHEKEKHFLEKQLERIQASYENVAKDAINRPTTSTHTTFNHIRNVLSTNQTVDSLKHDDLVLVFRKHLTEDVLLGGQRAIAKICSENIIQTQDDKMLLVCTDASRDKYKYMDNSGNVKEDVYARNFTKKIIKPLESVGQDVYDIACATIAVEREQLSCIEYSKEASLKSKEERLINSLFELKSVDIENYNSKFLNELSILTKRSI